MATVPFYITNDDFCVRSDEFRARNDDFCIINDGFCSKHNVILCVKWQGATEESVGDTDTPAMCVSFLDM